MSLTELSEELNEIAKSNFMDILRCMGDKPSVYHGDLKEPIIENAKKDKALTDEVFIQVMKQLTMNTSTRSAASGWELLQALCENVSPTHALGEFLRAFLEKRAAGNSGAGAPRKKSRGSMCGEAELRARDRTETCAAFHSNQEPVLAQETL